MTTTTRTTNKLATIDISQQSIAAEKTRRSLLQQYIKDQLVSGKDYGVIPGSTKPCLFKAGAEKFCSLLQLRAEFVRDSETVEMLKQEGVVAYICRLIHIPTGDVVSEGRGACSLKERQMNPNTTIKIAEKRAKVDAVLGLGLSDTYTQDLEDDSEITVHPEEPQTNRPRKPEPQPDAGPPALATQKQKDLIERLKSQKGIESVAEITGITATESTLTKKQASQIIDELLSLNAQTE